MDEANGDAVAAGRLRTDFERVVGSGRIDLADRGPGGRRPEGRDVLCAVGDVGRRDGSRLVVGQPVDLQEGDLRSVERVAVIARPHDEGIVGARGGIDGEPGTTVKVVAAHGNVDRDPFAGDDLRELDAVLVVDEFAGIRVEQTVEIVAVGVRAGQTDRVVVDRFAEPRTGDHVPCTVAGDGAVNIPLQQRSVAVGRVAIVHPLDDDRVVFHLAALGQACETEQVAVGIQAGFGHPETGISGARPGVGRNQEVIRIWSVHEDLVGEDSLVGSVEEEFRPVEDHAVFAEHAAAAVRIGNRGVRLGLKGSAQVVDPRDDIQNRGRAGNEVHRERVDAVPRHRGVAGRQLIKGHDVAVASGVVIAGVDFQGVVDARRIDGAGGGRHRPVGAGGDVGRTVGQITIGDRARAVAGHVVDQECGERSPRVVDRIDEIGGRGIVGIEGYREGAIQPGSPVPGGGDSCGAVIVVEDDVDVVPVGARSRGHDLEIVVVARQVHYANGGNIRS